MLEIRDIDKGIRIYGLKDFSLVHIFECGQAFRWNQIKANHYAGIAKGRYIELKEGKDYLDIVNTNRDEFYDIWFDYFDLKTDYSVIKAELSKKDEYLKGACEFGYGIRILKQEAFETLISFIISANNNIPRIKKCIESLCINYGEKIGGNQYSFPKAESLAKIDPDDIRIKTRTGYRADYISHAAKLFVDRPFNRDSFDGLTIEEGRKLVMDFKGVGPKVADCILLFSGSYMEAFPTDVWVERVMDKLYGLKNKKDIYTFVKNYFASLGGFAQQYLFYAIRENHLAN